MSQINIGDLTATFKVGSSDCSIYLGDVKLYPTGSHDYSQDYFTIVSESDDNTISILKSGSAPAITVSASTDDGQTWTEFSGGTIVTIDTGDKLLLKGVNNKWSSGRTQYNYIATTSTFHVEGNIMSLLYGDNFVNQTSLSGKDYCFRRFLYNNTNVTSAENLVLPATTLADYCYSGMFYGCTNLTAVPELSAATLAQYCYEFMFENCTSLTTAPELPATTLAQYCYNGMFQGCSGLTTAPVLSATTLAQSCYSGMFSNCANLTTAPELPATTLVSNCYNYMFNGCTSLNYIKCLATDISATNCTTNWVYGVAASGTFVKDASMTSWTIGNSGIPSGWSVKNYPDYLQDYFTMNITTGGNIKWSGSTTANTLSYSKDNGQTWATANSATTISVNAGDKVLWKGTPTPQSSNGIGKFSGDTDVRYSVEGNAMSLLFGDNFVNQTSLSGKDYAFANLFRYNTNVTSAENMILPATTLADRCYQTMFNRSSSLTTAPKLPATALADGCYNGMFINCTSLTTAPELPATTLAMACYSNMFYDCTSLTTAPELPATTLATQCYSYMFNGCTSLTTAPELPATTLATQCYSYMFNGCTSLNYIKCLATDISALDCTNSWVSGVAASGTFVKAASMTGWTTGNNGIPSGWTVEDDTHDYSLDYFTIVSEANNNTVSIVAENSAPSITVSASTDNGQTWTEYTGGTIATLNTGDKVLLKGVNNKWGAALVTNYNKITASASFHVEGNIMSLLYGDNFVDQTSISGRKYAFQCLFDSVTTLTSAENLILPATTLASNCYGYMFSGCGNLTAAPELPATTLASDCYRGMLQGCSSLTKAPELPAPTLAIRCYAWLFNGCSSLNYIKCLATNISASYCTNSWVNGVAASGTFVKAASMTGWTTGNNGIPSGWTVQNAS